MRRISPAIQSAPSMNPESPSGMKRPGSALHHSSTCQSLYARIMHAARSVSPLCRKYCPPRPGHEEKHIEPSTPFTFMSRTRSWTS